MTPEFKIRHFVFVHQLKGTLKSEKNEKLKKKIKIINQVSKNSFHFTGKKKGKKDCHFILIMGVLFNIKNGNELTK